MNGRKFVLAVLIGFVLLTSIQCHKKEIHTASTEKNKAAVKRQVDEAWNKGNVAALDEIMAADLIFHDSPPGTAPGLDGFKQNITSHRAAIPDLQCTIQDMVAEGDKVAVRWSWTGTQKGPYLGVPPTGKQVTLNGISIHRFEGGKIVENWHKMDTLSLLEQFGVSPLMGQTEQ